MFQNSFSFKGRITRFELFISYLIIILAISLYGPILSWIESMFDYEVFRNVERFFTFFVCIIGLWFMVAQKTKRCHDIGKSGWYQLIPFYELFLIFQEGEIGINKYDISAKKKETEISSIEITNEVVLPNNFFNSIKEFSKNCKTAIKNHSKNIDLKNGNIFNKLTSDEVIIISIIVGSVCFLGVGNLFGETKYDSEYRKKVIDFNYTTAIIGFIIISGITYIFLNRKSNKTN